MKLQHATREKHMQPLNAFTLKHTVQSVHDDVADLPANTVLHLGNVGRYRGGQLPRQVVAEPSDVLPEDRLHVPGPNA